MSDLISREAAFDEIIWNSDNGVIDAKVAIEALRKLPSVTPEPKSSDDCVSRKDTIAWLKKVTVTDGITFETGFKQIIRDIEQMPSVTPERQTGKWIEYQERKKQIYAECSNCGFKNYAGILNYCPECGAKMEVQDGTR